MYHAVSMTGHALLVQITIPVTSTTIHKEEQVRMIRVNSECTPDSSKHEAAFPPSWECTCA